MDALSRQQLHTIFVVARLAAGDDRKPVGVAVPERVAPFGGHRRLGARDLGEKIVHEREDRRMRSKADGDRAPRRAVGPQSFDERRRLIDDRDVGVAEAVDRLLAVADHEDRRRQGIGGRAEAFAPALHELAHERPLRAARVLEFVDEDVPVARLEAQAALGELVHLLEELDRALENAGEIEERVRLERLLVLAERDGEDSPDAARHHRVQIASERLDRVGDGGRELRGGGAMAAPGVLRVAVGAGEPGAGELVAARPPACSCRP